MLHSFSRSQLCVFTLEPHQSHNAASLCFIRLHLEQVDILPRADGMAGAPDPPPCSSHNTDTVNESLQMNVDLESCRCGGTVCR